MAGQAGRERTEAERLVDRLSRKAQAENRVLCVPNILDVVLVVTNDAEGVRAVRHAVDRRVDAAGREVELVPHTDVITDRTYEVDRGVHVRVRRQRARAR